MYVTSSYDTARQRFSLNFQQGLESSGAQAQMKAMHIPVRLGLLLPDGSEQALRLADQAGELGTECVLDVTEAQQTFVFEGVEQPVLPSLLRGFSAPVRLSYDYSDRDLGFLLSHDSDAYNRWEAAQQLLARVIRRNAEALQSGADTSIPDTLLEGVQRLLKTPTKTPPCVPKPSRFPAKSRWPRAKKTIHIDELYTAGYS